MRRALDALYDASAWIAALFMIAILASILVQVLGGVFGFYVRGTDAYAGYAMAGVSFLALAHTLKRGEHIRVTLLLQRLHGRPRLWLEAWCLAVATVLSGLFAWYSWKMVWWSWAFTDVSMAEDRTPLWIPQTAMAFGVSVLFVAFLDDTVRLLRGRLPIGGPAASSRSE
ncbi:TRAP transporter small permease [Arenibaculum sp.]|jgi:TRAP-type C4-dicarboxylate transport system permease small subunit|uniref:TRAP transporter small permease n=1 Tax=Arenibaculum sp. TaxID=2865862 RepID=UPI002E0FFB7C|nr:TRAP transporter small permease [Arenibaculum sp.]